MHQPLAVNMIERRCNLFDRIERLGFGQPSFLFKQRVDVVPLHKFHHQKVVAIGMTHIEPVDDVGMIELERSARSDDERELGDSLSHRQLAGRGFVDWQSGFGN